MIACGLGLAVSGPAAGQRVLEEFSYDSLRLSGMQVDLGIVGSNDLETAAIGGLRIDWGYFAPRVRLLTGVSYTRSDIKAREILRFERRIRELVVDPSGDDSIRIGPVRLTSVILDVDLQYLITPSPASPVIVFLGGGFAAHIRNASGDAIEDTFVEDALDTVEAGLNGMLGLEVPVGNQVRAVFEARASATMELAMVSARVGVMYRFRPGL